MRRLVLVVAAVLLATLVVEIGLRNIGGVFHDDFLAADPVRGWSLRPGFSGWMNDERAMWVTINSDGLRDREHAVAPTPGTLRVAVLGDSYMQGLNVPVDQTFPAVLEQQLTACIAPAASSAETLNFGVSGYGTAQELLTYRHHASGYQPAIVILAFYPNNDVFNNSRALNPTQFADQSPYFTLDGDRLVLDAGFRDVLAANARQPWWRRARMAVTSRLRTAQLVYDMWGSVRPRLFESPGDSAGGDRRSRSPLENEIYREPTRQDAIDAWRVTEALLLQLNREVTADGAQLWLVTLAGAAELNPQPAVRAAFAKELAVDSLDYAGARLRAFAERHGIPAIGLAQPLTEYATEHHAYLTGGYNARVPAGEGHWNETANREAARIVAARVCAARKTG